MFLLTTQETSFLFILFLLCNQGASADGIGAGTAIYFAKNGAKLVLTGRNEEGLKETAIDCQKASPTKEKVLINLFRFYFMISTLPFLFREHFFDISITYNTVIVIHLFKIIFKKCEYQNHRGV